MLGTPRDELQTIDYDALIHSIAVVRDFVFLSCL